jgi:hypothetical protein
MMGGYGYGMGPGMMGGYGMGSGMMGGYGMGPGMMGGCGMGSGMMSGMGYGMMGPGMMYSYGPEFKKYLDETKDLRKSLHMKMFDYMEALRDPETTREAITTLRKEMSDLITELRKKAPRGFYGY